MKTVDLQCTCGKVKGTLHNISKTISKRMICMCDDCQAFAHYLGRGDILDANGGTDIFPMAPGNLKITAGLENIKCLRLTYKGMHRWYADCCKTPIANSMAAPNFPYHGMMVANLSADEDKKNIDDAIGPVAGRMQGKYGIPPLPPHTPQTVSPIFLLYVMRMLAHTFATGKGKPSPFFSKDGTPISTPHILTSAERDNLRPVSK